LTGLFQISILISGYFLVKLNKLEKRREGEGMPSYDYRCPKCKKKFTAILSFREHDARKAKCPNVVEKNWNNSLALSR